MGNPLCHGIGVSHGRGESLPIKPMMIATEVISRTHVVVQFILLICLNVFVNTSATQPPWAAVFSSNG
jgi:hypothetical protein